MRGVHRPLLASRLFVQNLTYPPTFISDAKTLADAIFYSMAENAASYIYKKSTAKKLCFIQYFYNSLLMRLFLWQLCL